MLCWLHPSISIGTIHFWHVFHKAIIESRLTSWIKALKMVTRQAQKDTMYLVLKWGNRIYFFFLTLQYSFSLFLCSKQEWKTIKANTAKTPDFNEWGVYFNTWGLPDNCLATSLVKIHFSMLTNMGRLTKYHKFTNIIHLD